MGDAVRMKMKDTITSILDRAISRVELEFCLNEEKIVLVIVTGRKQNKEGIGKGLKKRR